jgi:hypothetical protein
MTTLQSPTRAILFPIPYSLLYSPFLPLKSAALHPPTLWKSFFGPSMARNLHCINILYFSNVNESVTETPVYCQFLAQKEAILARKALIFAFPESPQVPQFEILELGIHEPLASG